MQNAAKQLETLEKSDLIKYIQELEKSLKDIKFDNMVLEEQIKLLTYKRFAQSAEKMLAAKNQIILFNEEEIPQTPIDNTSVEITEVRTHKRRKNPNAGRKAISEKLLRVKRIIDLEESQKDCGCGAKLERIGEEITEKLVYKPAEIYVDEIARQKYACRNCEGTEDEENATVRIAPVEPSMVPKGIATPGLLSCIFIQKFEDHLPYYRQEKQFERIGVTLSRQDMSNWQQQVYNRIKPLLLLLKETLLSHYILKMDETTVKVIGEKEKPGNSKSYMWLMLGGPPQTPVVMYQYRQTRAAEHAIELLKGYSGYLQTDGYKGYDCALKDNDKIIHVSCFAHSRRYFFEAAQVSKNVTAAQEGVEYIKKLYVIENKLRKETAEDENDTEDKRIEKRGIFLNERKKLCVPVLAEFKVWLLKLENEVPPKTRLGEAVGYTLGQWEKLIRYLDNPYLTPDNNACENSIRPFVMGRKAWLFCQSPSGAESSCGMYSLIQTAKLNKINTFEYLKTVFEKAPTATSLEDWEKLLPWNIFKS